MNLRLGKKQEDSKESYSKLVQKSVIEARQSKTIFVVDAGKNLYNLAIEIRDAGGLDAYLDRDKLKTPTK